MRKIEIDCYAIYQDYDKCSAIVGYASNPDVAYLMTLGKDGKVDPYRRYAPYKKTYQILETDYDVKASRQQKLIESALAKLTKEEKEALGLK